MIVYCFTNKLNNKKYIGITNNLKRRISSHKRSNGILGKAIRKYGIDSFNIKVLESVCSIDEACNLEVKYIKKLNTIVPVGYNIELGGNYKSSNPSSVLKIRKAKKKSKDLPLDCQITFIKDTNKYRLRAYYDKKRISLGNFDTKEEAVNYFEFCKNKKSYIKFIYPRVGISHGRYRLRITKDGIRQTIGHFDTKSDAFLFYYKRFYNGYNYSIS